jgi:DNA-binding transcriptional MerR regulator
MRLAGLALASGCSVATIKYYIREGLLEPGRLRHAKEAEYEESHLARLKLIRVLRDLGELSIADISRVIAALGETNLAKPQKLAAAYYSLPPHPTSQQDVDDEARREVLAYAEAHGWQVTPEAPAVALFAEALAAARSFWGPVGPEIFERYALAIDALARGDVEVLTEAEDPAETVRQVVVGTVVWDRAIIALRRLAADHYSTLRFGEVPAQ